MIIKLERVGFKKNGLFVFMDGSNKHTWMDIVGNEKNQPEAVKKLISDMYKPGAEMKLDFHQDDKGDYKITNVIGNSEQTKSTTSVNNTTVTNVSNTDKVGAEEKKTTGKVYTKPVYAPRDTGRSIELQNCGRNTAETIKGMPGYVNPDNVLDLIEKIFNKYIEKIQV